MYKYNNTISRGDIFYANLGDHSTNVGSEQYGHRPVIILQNNKGNYYSPTVVVAIVTSQDKKKLPTHVNIENPLREASTICAEQIRTIDKSRLGNYIGHASPAIMAKVDKAVNISLGLDNALDTFPPFTPHSNNDTNFIGFMRSAS